MARAAWLSVILVAGCNTPSSICEDLRDSVNAMYDRCHLDGEFVLVDREGDVRSCDEVTQIDEPNAILCECIPWTETADCAAVEAGDFHPSCDEGTFRGPDF